MRKNNKMKRRIIVSSADMKCSTCGLHISRCHNPKCQKYFEQDDKIYCVRETISDTNSFFHYCGDCKGEAKSGK